MTGLERTIGSIRKERGSGCQESAEVAKKAMGRLTPRFSEPFDRLGMTVKNRHHIRKRKGHFSNGVNFYLENFVSIA
jgi:hypothetical protein